MAASPADVLWNDIEWPDAGKHDGALGLVLPLYQTRCSPT